MERREREMGEERMERRERRVKSEREGGDRLDRNER